MDDEFEFDDLDDTVISAINDIENKYAAASNQVTEFPQISKPLVVPKQNAPTTPRVTTGPPPPKRPRTETWGAQNSGSNQPTPNTAKPSVRPPPARIARTTSIDDIPDISLAADGSYFISKPNSGGLSSSTFGPPKVVPPRPPDPKPAGLTTNTPTLGVPPRRNVITRGSETNASRVEHRPKPLASNATPSNPTPQALARPPSIHRSLSSTSIQSSQGERRGLSRSVSSGSKVLASGSSQEVIVNYHGPFTTPFATPKVGLLGALPNEPNEVKRDGSNVPVPPDSASSFEMTELKDQLAKLRMETESLKESLKQAERSRLLKEGEASNIRRLMDQQAQTHANDLERIKTERDTKIATALKAQETLQATIDGLKTQLMFKQHETDLSSAKWNVGGSTKKKGHPQMSQLHVAQTPRRAGASLFTADRLVTPRRGLTATPQRPQPSPKRSDRVRSPGKGHDAGRSKGGRSENKPVPQLQFASFQNSFAKGTSPVKRRGGGRLRDIPSSPTKVPGTPDTRPILVVDRPPQSSLPEIVIGDLGPEDVIATQDRPTAPTETPTEPWRPNYKKHLHSLLFSHVPVDMERRPKRDAELTLQTLLSTSFPSTTPDTTISSYRRGCSLILSTFGSHVREDDWVATVHDVAAGLVMCFAALASQDMFSVLTPVLQLIDSLIILIPQFDTQFLPSSPDNDVPSLLSTFATIIRTNFAPPPSNLKDKTPEPPPEWDPIKTSLASGILNAVESLTWSLASHSESSSSVPKLATFLTPDCLNHLIDPAQPAWFLKGSLRLLLVTSAHESLHKPLLCFSSGNLSPPKEEDLATNVVLQKLSGYLMTPHRWWDDADVLSMSRYILAFFMTISEVHEDGMKTVLQSLWVIPSLVSYLMRHSARVFEDDDTLLGGSEEVQMSVIRAIYPALHLLWSLVKPWDPVVNLRVKIIEAAARYPQHFNGLHHLFILALGRLSFADPPDWLPKPGKDSLVKMGEMARDLLDTVVEGPESDTIWEAYQECDEEADMNPGADEEGDADEDLARQMGMEVDEGPARETNGEAALRENMTIGHSKFIAEAEHSDDWQHANGSRRVEEASSTAKRHGQQGRLLPTTSHLFKLVLPLPGLRPAPARGDVPKQQTTPKPPPPTVFLLHPSQPLSHISRLIQASLPSPTHGPQPFSPRLPTVSFQNATDTPNEDQSQLQWSDSTDIGDFVKDAAQTREFTIVITPDQTSNTAQLASTEDQNATHEKDRPDAYEPLEIVVSVPSFQDRTRYLRQRLRRLERELKGMQELKDSCDALARRGAKRLATGGFIILAVYWVVVLRLTFYSDYGWDTMEPVTYLTEFLVILGGYVWFLRQGREISYTSILNQSVSTRRRALYASKGLDIERWADLVTEEKAIKKEIEKIREDYEGGWKENNKPKDDEEEANLKDEETRDAINPSLLEPERRADASIRKVREAVEEKREKVVKEEEGESKSSRNGHL
ncbi:hypothetical protein FRB99_001478 [Tulasnella sp. 403]|nr:hypothetical protein FRB99_001478 [Tulasnella sp. 403]